MLAVIDSFLVAFDGSELSRAAFAHAVMLSQAAGTRVRALHAIEPGADVLLADPALAMDPALTTSVPAAPPAEQRRWAQVELSELKTFCDEADIEFEPIIVEDMLLDALRDAAGPRDVVTVGRAGRFRSAGVGSMTKALVCQSGLPVMVVNGPVRPVNRVLVAYDGSGVALHALRFAETLARQAGWPITAVAVSRGAVTADAAAEQLAALSPGIQIMPTSLGKGKEAAQIAEFAEADEFGLLVMGAYADSIAHEIFFGSTTSSVLHKVTSPAILVRERFDGVDEDQTTGGTSASYDGND